MCFAILKVRHWNRKGSNDLDLEKICVCMCACEEGGGVCITASSSYSFSLRRTPKFLIQVLMIYVAH